MSNIDSVTEYHDKLEALSPAMRERTAQAEELRRVPDLNITELGAAGLFRVFQPAKFGGAELSMAAVLPMITHTAKACPSTAWVMAVLQIHAWVLGLCSEKAQDEVYGDDPERTISERLQEIGNTARISGIAAGAVVLLLIA